MKTYASTIIALFVIQLGFSTPSNVSPLLTEFSINSNPEVSNFHTPWKRHFSLDAVNLHVKPDFSEGKIVMNYETPIHMTLSITNMVTGKVVSTEKFFRTPGQLTKDIDFTAFGPGSYSIILESERLGDFKRFTAHIPAANCKTASAI